MLLLLLTPYFPQIFLDEFHLSPLKIHISFSPQMFIDTTQVLDSQPFPYMWVILCPRRKHPWLGNV